MNDVSNRWALVIRSVSDFQVHMLDKLWHHRRKMYWMDVPDEGPEYYLTRLKEETEELETAMFHWTLNVDSAQSVVDECADVANFAMMIADKVKALDTSKEG